MGGIFDPVFEDGREYSTLFLRIPSVKLCLTDGSVIEGSQTHRHPSSHTDTHTNTIHTNNPHFFPEPCSKPLESRPHINICINKKQIHFTSRALSIKTNIVAQFNDIVE